jgi:hypothetical protein
MGEESRIWGSCCISLLSIFLDLFPEGIFQDLCGCEGGVLSTGINHIQVGSGWKCQDDGAVPGWVLETPGKMGRVSLPLVWLVVGGFIPTTAISIPVETDTSFSGLWPVAILTRGLLFPVSDPLSPSPWFPCPVPMCKTFIMTSLVPEEQGCESVLVLPPETGLECCQDCWSPKPNTCTLLAHMEALNQCWVEECLPGLGIGGPCPTH